MKVVLLQRYIPLAVWVVAICTLVLIPFKIIGLGFLPMDDALRHAAKTISGKSWQEILVMREGFDIDPSPGWQKILEWVHGGFGGNAETLVVFSVVGLMLLVTLGALPWLRRPEAWLGALLVATVFVPACTTRFMRGRPYLLTDTVLIAILFLWSRRKDPSAGEFPRWPVLVFTTLLVAASAWIHGSWYMLVLPGAAVLLAGFWRPAIAYGGLLAGRKFSRLRVDGSSVGILVAVRAAHVRRVRQFRRQPPAGTGILSFRWRHACGACGGCIPGVADAGRRLESARGLEPGFHDDAPGLAARAENAEILVGLGAAGVPGLVRARIAGTIRSTTRLRFGAAIFCHPRHGGRRFARVRQ